jgi:hypothetical protein
MHTRTLASAVVIATLGASVLIGDIGGWQARAAGLSAMFDLAGRWSGDGTVKPTKRPVQPFKCIATYFSGAEGVKWKQNLRCQNSDYKLEVATLLQIQDDKIKGTWQEKTYGLTGTLTGDVVDNRMEMHLKGEFFKAEMTILSSQCQQDVLVTPVKSDQIEYLTASLKKC